MRLSRRSLGLFARLAVWVLVLTALTAHGALTTARAAAPECPQRAICTWDQPNFEGRPNTYFTAPTLCHNDDFRSIATGQALERPVVYFDAPDCTGTKHVVTAGAFDVRGQSFKEEFALKA